MIPFENRFHMNKSFIRYQRASVQNTFVRLPEATGIWRPTRRPSPST